jgi:PadR family transcriptional regulator PadR
VDELGPWLAQLRKGIVELLILRLLGARGELHGYAIVKHLQELGPIVAGESTVYPVLKRLESDGLVAAHWVESPSGPPRKYYRRSEDGERFLALAVAEWDGIVSAMESLTGEESHG